MPIKKNQSQLFLDWPANMGFDVLYTDSMEGMSTNDLNNRINCTRYHCCRQTLLYIDYKLAGRMGEGTFSEVLKCQSLLDGKLYACKKMKQKYDRCVSLINHHHCDLSEIMYRCIYSYRTIFFPIYCLYLLHLVSVVS